MLSLAAVLFAGATAVSQTEGENAFRAYTDFAIGGVWTTTVDNETVEHTYRKITDGKFIQLTAKGGKVPFDLNRHELNTPGRTPFLFSGKKWLFFWGGALLRGSY